MPVRDHFLGSDSLGFLPASRLLRLTDARFISEAQATERYRGGANLRVDDLTRVAFLKA